jgi:hypothetical protein
MEGPPPYATDPVFAKEMNKASRSFNKPIPPLHNPVIRNSKKFPANHTPQENLFRAFYVHCIFDSRKKTRFVKLFLSSSRMKKISP